MIHRRPIVCKNLDTNEYIISARNPKIGYVKTYRNELGQAMTYDDRYFIKRRHEMNKSNERFVIKSSKGYKFNRISKYKSNEKEATLL